MTELSAQAKALLDAGNAGLAPSAATKAQILAAVEVNAAAGVAAGGTGVFASGLVSLKLVGVILVATGIGGGYWLSRSGGETKQSTKDSIIIPNTATDIAPTPPPVQRIAVAPQARSEDAIPEPNKPVGESKVAGEPAPKTRSVAKPTPKPSEKQTLQAEQKLIAAAQAAMRKNDYAGAMMLLASHRRKFPRGILAPERNAATAIAHCKSGKDGRAIAERFLRKHKDSPLAERVRTSCHLEP